MINTNLGKYVIIAAPKKDVFNENAHYKVTQYRNIPGNKVDEMVENLNASNNGYYYAAIDMESYEDMKNTYFN